MIADLSSGPPLIFPLKVFTANAAWLVLAAMADNLLRAAGTFVGARRPPPRAGLAEPVDTNLRAAARAA